MGNEFYGFVLRTPDMQSLKKFYETAFDIRFEEHTDHGPRHYAGRIGNSLIEIYPSKAKSEIHDSPMIGVDKIESFLLRIPNVHISRTPAKTPQGLMAIIKDSDGRNIIVMEKLNESKDPLNH